MHRTLLGSVAAVAIVTSLCGPVTAADLRMPVKAAPIAAPAPYAPTWTGYYIGVHSGYGWANVDTGVALSGGEARDNCGATHCAVLGSVKPQGAVLGIQSGYNWQLGPSPWGAWVFGIESDVSITPWESGDFRVATQVHSNSRIDWLSSIRGRLGIAIDRTLIYGTGGIAWVGGKHDIGGSSTRNVQRFHTVGAVAGLGVEWRYNQNLNLRVEWLHYLFDHADNIAPTPNGTNENTPVPVKVTDIDVIRLGANWMFGPGDALPFGKGVTARY